jgi:hypothetical protein
VPHSKPTNPHSATKHVHRTCVELPCSMRAGMASCTPLRGCACARALVSVPSPRSRLRSGRRAHATSVGSIARTSTSARPWVSTSAPDWESESATASVCTRKPVAQLGRPSAAMSQSRDSVAVPCSMLRSMLLSVLVCVSAHCLCVHVSVSVPRLNRAPRCATRTRRQRMLQRPYVDVGAGVGVEVGDGVGAGVGAGVGLHNIGRSIRRGASCPFRPIPTPAVYRVVHLSTGRLPTEDRGSHLGVGEGELGSTVYASTVYTPGGPGPPTKYSR